MSLLSASELAAIQGVAQSGMTGTATILRRQITVTDNGQETTWATVGANVPCWIYEVTPVTATVGAVSGAIDLAEVFSIRLPVGSDVLSGDHLVIDGATFNVEHTNDEDTYRPWLDLACRKLVA